MTSRSIDYYDGLEEDIRKGLITIAAPENRYSRWAAGLDAFDHLPYSPERGHRNDGRINDMNCREAHPDAQSVFTTHAAVRGSISLLVIGAGAGREYSRFREVLGADAVIHGIGLTAVNPNLSLTDSYYGLRHRAGRISGDPTVDELLELQRNGRSPASFVQVERPVADLQIIGYLGTPPVTTAMEGRRYDAMYDSMGPVGHYPHLLPEVYKHLSEDGVCVFRDDRQLSKKIGDLLQVPLYAHDVAIRSTAKNDNDSIVIARRDSPVAEAMRAAGAKEGVITEIGPCRNLRRLLETIDGKPAA